MPSRTRLILALGAAVAALAVVLPAQAAPPRLDGTVGPGFTITLKLKGSAVKTLKAGSYRLVVNDLSSMHNFHLTGPGVRFTTSVGATGVKAVTITLRAGRYHYQCDPHAGLMKGDFKVV